MISKQAKWQTFGQSGHLGHLGVFLIFYLRELFDDTGMGNLLGLLSRSFPCLYFVCRNEIYVLLVSK